MNTNEASKVVLDAGMRVQTALGVDDWRKHIKSAHLKGNIVRVIVS